MLQGAYHVIALSIICLTAPAAAGRTARWTEQRRPVTVLWRSEYPQPTAAQQLQHTDVWSGDDEDPAPAVAWLEPQQQGQQAQPQPQPAAAGSPWLDVDRWTEADRPPRQRAAGPAEDGCRGGALDCLLRQLLRSDLERASQQLQQPQLQEQDEEQERSRRWRRRQEARQRRPESLLSARTAVPAPGTRTSRPSGPTAGAVERRSGVVSSSCVHRCAAGGGSAAHCSALCSALLQPPRSKKKSPSCMRRCMMQGLLHPAQCHSLC